MKKNTIKYEYKMPILFKWHGKEYGKDSTQKELEEFAAACPLWPLFLKKKGGEK